MEADTSDPASPPDPPQDQPGDAMPEYIAVVLRAVGILLGYGRHLVATVHRRAAAPTFPSIAAAFGTANLSTILAHLNRGILRATALQHMLLARAETGRDISIVTRRIRTTRTTARTNRPPTRTASGSTSQAQSRVTPIATPRLMTIPNSSCPQWRSSSVRCVVARSAAPSTEICRDLAVVPGFCTPAFWNDMFQVMHYFGGSVETLMREKARREQAFIQEQDKKLDSTWDWLHLKRDEIRQALGFFIGERPVDPFGQSPASCAHAAAPATGPP